MGCLPCSVGDHVSPASASCQSARYDWHWQTCAEYFCVNFLLGSLPPPDVTRMENPVALQKSPSRELRAGLRMLASAPDITILADRRRRGRSARSRDGISLDVAFSLSCSPDCSLSLSIRSPLSARCCSASLFPREKRAFFGTKETDKKERERRRSGAKEWELGRRHSTALGRSLLQWCRLGRVRVQQLPPCRPIYGD